MKIIRHDLSGRMPLKEWLSDKLPPSLVMQETSLGYGSINGVYRRGEEPRGFARFFGATGDPIALVDGRSARLYFPEYFSDFEDLLRRYEASVGGPVTLEYWEAP